MARTKKLRIGVLFGGRSGEHEISLRSALTVMSAMDPRRYQIVPIGIARDGRWSLQSDAMRMLTEATPKLGRLGRGGLPVSLLPYPDSRALVTMPSRNGHAHNRHAAPPLPGPLDVVFPVLHGTFGEDGTVQGLLDLAGIPYVGAGVLGSAIGMDKDVQKRLLASAGIPVVRYFALTASDYDRKPALARRYANELGYPVFVKPNALGSSIGITRVTSVRKLAPALTDAFQYDRKVLLEAACEGRELECAVLGNDQPSASIPGEIVIKHGHGFYSYDSKYIDPDGADTRIPADLPAAITRRIRELSIAAFKTLSLRGMARVDFLARPDLSQIFINEVNTIPGFTSISMYPKLWEATGVTLPQLIDRLIELAIEDHRQRSALKFTYQPQPAHD
ncbi:MAG TPA: D-alanine--D-alanine ligase family protein [Candidatus Binataceae bacterium]|nr:D-alanine--D-alanine ligase family protein [Candidatus Binataceae bacterium]